MLHIRSPCCFAPLGLVYMVRPASIRQSSALAGTALQAAARGGHLNDSSDQAPLSYAAEKGHKVIVQLLLIMMLVPSRKIKRARHRCYMQLKIGLRLSCSCCLGMGSILGLKTKMVTLHCHWQLQIITIQSSIYLSISISSGTLIMLTLSTL